MLLKSAPVEGNVSSFSQLGSYILRDFHGSFCVIENGNKKIPVIEIIVLQSIINNLCTGLNRARISVSPGGLHSAGHSQDRVQRILYEAYHSQVPCTNLTGYSFVFVHGLNPRGRNDHPFETWTHSNGKFWPTEFLAEDIPFARVFVYGYNSSITHPQTMSTASIKDHANTLLNLLDMERSPQLVSATPIS